MVGKLIKHEIVRGRTLLGVIFGVATLLVLVGAVMNLTKLPLVAGLGFTLAVVGAAALVPASQLALAIIYWRSSYRQEGYFTQTLPIKGTTIYWVKLLWSVLVMIAAVVWTGVLALVAWLGQVGSFGNGLAGTGQMLRELLTGVAEFMPTWAWFAGPVLVVLFLAYALVQYFFAASIGSERRFNSLGWGGPVIVWFLVYMVLQVLTFVSILLIPVGFSVSASGVHFETVNYLKLLLASSDDSSIPFGMIPMMLLVMGALIWRTLRSWSRHTSLA